MEALRPTWLLNSLDRLSTSIPTLYWIIAKYDQNYTVFLSTMFTPLTNAKCSTGRHEGFSMFKYGRSHFCFVMFRTEQAVPLSRYLIFNLQLCLAPIAETLSLALSWRTFFKWCLRTERAFAIHLRLSPKIYMSSTPRVQFRESARTKSLQYLSPSYLDKFGRTIYKCRAMSGIWGIYYYFWTPTVIKYTHTCTGTREKPA